MNSLENALIANIVKFTGVLRQAGIRTSISETLDAVEALKFINLLDKSEVRATLVSCLAKSHQERQLFFECFEQFFIAYDTKREMTTKRQQEIETKVQAINEEAAEIKFQDESIELPEELKEVYYDLAPEEKQNILDYAEKTSNGKNIRSELKPLFENMIKKRLKTIKGKQVQDNVGKSLMHKNINDIDEVDRPKAIYLIRLLAKSLSTEVARAYKKNSKKGRLNFRKSLRTSLTTGGVQFNLSYYKRPPKKTKYLLLYDVSTSMVQFSSFGLQFMMGLNDQLSDIVHYIFSEDIKHINIRKYSVGDDLKSKISSSETWGKGTNINNAFKHLLFSRDKKWNSSTVLIILSDAKTLEATAAAEHLAQLKRQLKDIIWLNPITKAEWAHIASIDALRMSCKMYDCSTLDHLAKACKKEFNNQG